MSLEELRRQYTMAGLTEAEMPDTPLDLFSTWMQTALESAPEDWVEPYAFTLATGNEVGRISARIVLLRGFDEHGFVFYTNYESAKGEQLRSNPNAAMVFYWGYLERQVRVTGTVERVSRELSAAYFGKRPRGSQIGAVVSKQSSPISSRAELEVAVQQYERDLGANSVPLPDSWGGYRLLPRDIEFWQGRENRLHDRLVYQREAKDWRLLRLSP